jgi:cytochrome P450
MRLRLSPSPLSAREFFRDPLGYVRSSGEDVHTLELTAGLTPFAVVRDPDEIWRVLVTNSGSFRQGRWKTRARRFLGDNLNTLDGEAHRRRRLLMQPCLDRRRIAGFGPAIVTRAERLQAGWRDGDFVQLRDELDRLSLAVAGEVLLSTELGPEAPELARDLSVLMTRMPRLSPPAFPTRQSRALARIDTSIRALIDERRGSPGNDGDLLGVLLASGLPDQQVVGELIAFLLAAVDEPPSGLEAAWYLLARDRAAEERFHAELDAVLGDSAVSLEDEPRLPYLNAVLSETLRILPPTRYVDRCPVHETEIGGVRVPAGANVLIGPIVTHHEPRLYDRPEAFVPERWLDSSLAKRRGAYLPFGAGPHTCIGEPLARAIMTLTLATIGRRWRIRVSADAGPPVPGNRLAATVERR